MHDLNPAESKRRVLGVSVALHVVVLALVLLVPSRSTKPQEAQPIDIVFYAPEKPERVAPEPPKPKPEPEIRPKPRPEPEPKVQPPKPKRQPKPKPEPKPEPTLAQTRPEPPPAPKPKPRRDVVRDVLARAPEPKAAPPRPRAVAVKGSFGEAKAVTAAPQAPRSRVVAGGRFSDGALTVPPPAPSPSKRATVMKASFEKIETQAATTPAPAPAREVAATGFASDAPDSSAGTAPRASRGAVQAGSFGSDEVRAPEPPRRERAKAGLDTPVEVLSKARPVYTDEARKLRVEGEVVLEVTFEADGGIRVLRVVDGLGHGLDEAAIDAASRIKFNPARRGGEAVDHTATLRVVFRLA
ncbi:MAG: energy transducer TonB [bacterium]|nr:energy transducer TonB [bacterium]